MGLMDVRVTLSEKFLAFLRGIPNISGRACEAKTNCDKSH